MHHRAYLGNLRSLALSAGFAAGLLASGVTNAAVARSATSEMTLYIYGLYTTEDPTCQTGLVPTLPISATPQEANMVNGPTLGKGGIPKSINCAIIVLRNKGVAVLRPGDYSDTTTSGGSDAVCNAGQTLEFEVASANASISWPSKIEQDLNKAGLSAITRLPAVVTRNEVVPIYISTYSKCTGSYIHDQTISGCYVAGNSTNDLLNPPTAPNDTTKGLQLTAPPRTGKYVFYADTNQLWGYDAMGGNCAMSTPRFGFKSVTK